MPAFTLRGVTKLRYHPAADGLQAGAALADVTAEIPDRSLCLLLGPSGSGKSTLLRLLNRLEDPDRGEIRLDGTPLCDLPVLALRRRVVMVGQQPAMFPGTVGDNLSYALRLRSLPRAEIDGRTRESLSQVGLPDELLERPADRLSVGQQQRVCLARALALRPEALLLDEPTAALDPASAGIILRLVCDLQTEMGLTVVYVTHRLAEAQALGGTALLLDNGRIVESGETRSVLAGGRARDVLGSGEEAPR
jgi:putative ABC transport system ATP-binding protein